jgi:threonine/homoserine/homoserine lactone efflux protein
MTVLNYGLRGESKSIFWFALAAGLVEFFYALLAIQFKHYLIDQIIVEDVFKLIAGLTMLTIGFFYLIQKPAETSKRYGDYKRGAFLRGGLLGLLNPLAIPFWILVTGYLESNEMIKLGNTYEIILYCVGISTGTISLLIIVGFLPSRLSISSKKWPALYKLPGIILVFLGLYQFTL